MASSAFSVVLSEGCPEDPRQKFGRGTFGLRTRSIPPQAAVSACWMNGVVLRQAECAFEEVDKHTAAPDALAAGLTRCLKG